MSALKYETKPAPELGANILNIKLSGSIDEEVKFPDPDSFAGKSINIDLSGITAINSVGIREWIDWANRVAARVTAVSVTLASRPMVHQINAVSGFLPEKVTVRSLMVPFFCEACDREIQVPLDLSNLKSSAPADCESTAMAVAKKSCDKASCELEPDFLASKYFGFLKRKA